MKPSDDPLSDLGTHDVAPDVAQRIRRQALGVARERVWIQTHPRSAWISLWYYQLVEPTALVGLGLCYLLWALQSTAALLQ